MMEMGRGVKRARRGRWVLGVCSGIAQTYGWRPTTVRLVTVILALAIPGPSLVLAALAYLALGLALPESDEF
jgi:phage shock protein PspC (stress-responsive transcriptional regulator)